MPKEKDPAPLRSRAGSSSSDCEEEETRTPTGYAHYPLKVARLPFRHLSVIMTDVYVSLFFFACSRQESNLHVSQHSHLKRARLPFRHVSPPAMKSGKRDSNSRPQPWQGCALPTELFPQAVAATERSGAENEARTRDLNLGKVALCQLSYFRLFPLTKSMRFAKRGCKGRAFPTIRKSFHKKSRQPDAVAPLTNQARAARRQRDRCSMSQRSGQGGRTAKNDSAPQAIS